MRVSLPTTILWLAAALAWLGWSALPAAAGAPPMYQASQCWADAEQGQCGVEEQCSAPSGSCEIPCGCDPCGPRWVFAAEAIALQRTGTRDQTLYEEIDSVAPNSLNSRDLKFPVALGMAISGIRRDALGCGWDLELAYFQVDGFDARGQMPGFSFMVLDADSLSFDVTDGEARYTSAIYSGEINVRRRGDCEWLTLLAGFRMVELNERYRGTGIYEVFDGEFQQLTDTLFVDAHTFNHLYGFQLGAEAEVYNMGGPLQINARCKAGIYGNAAEQYYDAGFVEGQQVSVKASRDQAAFLGEAGLVATYALTKRLAFRASADAIWITGVALAPEQIGAVSYQDQLAGINTTGSVFYYGGGLGFEYRF